MAQQPAPAPAPPSRLTFVGPNLGVSWGRLIMFVAAVCIILYGFAVIKDAGTTSWLIVFAGLFGLGFVIG